MDDITKLTDVLRALSPEQQRDIVPSLIEAAVAFTAYAAKDATPPDGESSSHSFGFSVTTGRSRSVG
jgi:hypothetical protein